MTKQHQIDLIRLKLEKAEQNGFTKDSREQILAEAKASFNRPSMVGESLTDQGLKKRKK